MNKKWYVFTYILSVCLTDSMSYEPRLRKIQGFLKKKTRSPSKFEFEPDSTNGIITLANNIVFTKNKLTQCTSQENRRAVNVRLKNVSILTSYIRLFFCPIIGIIPVSWIVLRKHRNLPEQLSIGHTNNSSAVNKIWTFLSNSYVQHKIAEHRALLWQLITNNAHIYISGNAKNMPDNVRDAFIEDVIGKVGGRSADEAKRMVKDMEESGRFQVEAWWLYTSF